MTQWPGFTSWKNSAPVAYQLSNPNWCWQQVRELNPFTVVFLSHDLNQNLGDLTDAKTDLGSRQHETEWKMYAEILSSCKAMKNVQWLDLKGNHGQKKYFDLNNVSFIGNINFLNL